VLQRLRSPSGTRADGNTVLKPPRRPSYPDRAGDLRPTPHSPARPPPPHLPSTRHSLSSPRNERPLVLSPGHRPTGRHQPACLKLTRCIGLLHLCIPLPGAIDRRPPRRRWRTTPRLVLLQNTRPRRHEVPPPPTQMVPTYPATSPLRGRTSAQ